MIFFIFLFLSSLLIHTGDLSYYSIYRDGNLAAKSAIEYSTGSISERVLWVDGFSKEYTETDFTLFNEIKYSSKTYYENDKLPLTYTLDGTFIKKYTPARETRIKIKSDINFVHRNTNINMLVVLSALSSKKINYFDCDKNSYGEALLKNRELMLSNAKAIIFGCKNAGFDSAYVYGFKIVREKEALNIKNPYTFNISGIHTEDDFERKKRHIQFSYDCFSGEIAFDEIEDTIVVVLPFTCSSDYDGNIGNFIKPFTMKQIAENIPYPVLSLEIDFGLSDGTDLPEKILLLERELGKSYGKIIFIAFNDLCVDLAKSKAQSRKILFNPPLLNIDEWSRMVFNKYSAKKKYLFSNYEKFREFEMLNRFSSEMKLSELYSSLENSSFIFSKSAMTQSELDKASEIKGTIYYIKNIDRRLNSYNIYDLWSFEESIFISKKVLDFINGLIKK
ncbi:MAG: hypothetical protein PHW02_01005 [bacterium]|nr:hypothetical protein [bacterium]